MSNEFLPLKNQSYTDQRLLSLRDGKFLVKRNAYPDKGIPEHYEDGWSVAKVFEENGTTSVIINHGDSYKKLTVDQLISWQPVDGEPEENTIPRVPKVEYGEVENSPVAKDFLGEVAVGHLVVVDSEASHEEELSLDALRANERVSAVLGESGTAQNPLAEELLKIGDTPDSIRHALANKTSSDAVRRNVMWVLSRRMADLLAEGGHFHERIQDNSPNNLKSPNGNHGYDRDKYQSAEYVVLLALAKLDGSFDTSREKDYDDLPDDHEHQGQHRQASNKLLESFIRENRPVQPEVEPSDDERLHNARRVMDELRVKAVASAIGMQGYTDMLVQATHNEMIDLSQIHDTLITIQLKIQSMIEGLQYAAQIMHRLSMEEVAGSERLITETIEQSATDLYRTTNFLEQNGGEQVRMLIRKTDEAQYERNIQMDYRSTLRQRSREISEVIHMIPSMLHRIEL